MDNLLFYALIVALLYYFLVYLPAQKKPIQPNTRPDPQSSTTSQSTQTDFTETVITGPEAEPDPSLIKFPSNQSVKCPSPEDQKDLENALDFLIKGMADLSKEIDKI